MRTSLAGAKPGMSVTIRKARSADLGIIYDIRRDAILGIDSGDFGVIERQAWADRRSPEFFAGRVATGDVVLAVSGNNGFGWGSSSGDYISGVYVRTSLGRTGVGRASGQCWGAADEENPSSAGSLSRCRITRRCRPTSGAPRWWLIEGLRSR